MSRINQHPMLTLGDIFRFTNIRIFVSNTSLVLLLHSPSKRISCHSFFQEAMEESMQCFRMIPASNEAIQMSLKKSTVMARSERCPICLEELDFNAE
ncbi:E3 ubiquitin-protein ligase SDIR [Spatholobus suberectus]|nr:E3 ubiquitin-protein ligase SDIR [Spatholobus suberectus]